MKIGIDISQTIYHGGVGEYLTNLLLHLVSGDTKNEYIFFGSSFRGKEEFQKIKDLFSNNKNVSFKIFSFPPALLDLLWNRLHVLPIETLIGDIDIFITSDWTEPPAKHAKKLTILYDVIVYKYPEETDQRIVATQKRKLAWVKKETEKIICISQSTKKDAKDILGLPENKLSVILPGFTL
jgi:hypothetical protein